MSLTVSWVNSNERLIITRERKRDLIHWQWVNWGNYRWREAIDYCIYNQTILRRASPFVPLVKLPLESIEADGLVAPGPDDGLDMSPAAKRPKGWPEVIGNPGWCPRNRGLLTIRIFSISASFNLFSFALRFWNQILTCVSVRFSDEENSALSAMERYCFVLNFRSKARSCWVVNGVLGFLLLLCFRRVHLMFGSRWWTSGPSAQTE